MSNSIVPTEYRQPEGTREDRGLILAATKRIFESGGTWIVPSQNEAGVAYSVTNDRCTCPDHEATGAKCKHLWAVEFVITRETASDGSTRLTKTMRVTYQQEWRSYNAAQMGEESMFRDLLRSLCDGIEQPAQTNGRPRLPLSDVIYSLVMKAYAGKSGRRFTSALRDAEAAGLVSKAPHYNSAHRYMESADLTALLKQLIEESAAPLRAIETDFAVDSSGFATTMYDRWFDHKWGRMRSRNKWVKTHLMCGVKTNVVTTVEATPYESADAPFLAPFVQKTAETFDVREVSADKAYSSRKNLRAVQAVGGKAYIPFKARTTGSLTSHHERGVDPLWSRMWHYYQFNRSAFLGHYHKRSNVETTFSMIKMKFGGSVRAKTPTAQVNEVLCKVLAHNLCVLIASVFELGLEPVFWSAFEAKEAAAPKILSY